MFDSGGVAGVMLGHNAREATVDLDAANRREHGALTTETAGHEVATVIILAGLVGASSAERVVSVVQGAYGGVWGRTPQRQSTAVLSDLDDILGRADPMRP